MGGGTGTFPVIAALKRLRASITSVIAVSDSGGSTGRIRDEFGFPPVGDLRQALAALAEHNGEDWIRKILLYRFSKGDGLKGHNLGNLILTALQDMTGDTTQALAIAAKVFRISGQVIPVTTQTVNLKINYQDGSSIVGEHTLDQPTLQPTPIKSVELVPAAPLNPLAKAAIAEADLIVIGPGDYYASLMAVLVAEDLVPTLVTSKAKLVYVLNLMTRLTQTHNMTAFNHVAGIEAALNQRLDYILVNNEKISPSVLEFYQKEHEHPVVDNLGEDDRVVRLPLLSETIAVHSQHDTAHRSLLRHDSQKLERAFTQLL